jgi:cysteine desulfurase
MSAPLGLRTGPIYLDYNATTPVDPRVLDACLPYLTEHFGNPSSTHAYGRAARAAVDAARAAVAGLLGCAPGEVVFTGGGSEADTLAIRGAALVNRDRGDHIITQETEHPAISATVDALARWHALRVTRLPVDEHGLVRPSDLAVALTGGTVLVSIMHANGETGTIQPIAELADLAHAHGALFHTDAAQSVGKIPIAGLGVDLLTIAGHKLYAPKGVGALYVRAGLALEPAVYGGGQEGGLRSGTENVALTVALGAAARLASVASPSLRDLLHDQLVEHLPGRVALNGHPTSRLPNTLNVSIAGVSGRALLAAVPEIAASTGSACHEGVDAPSAVLTAMGIPGERALSAVRLSLGRWTTESDVDRAAKLLAAAAG